MLTKRVIAVTAAFGLIAAAVFGQASSAFANPPEPGSASCVGYEASNVSPPGTSGEAPGGMPNVLADLDAFFIQPNGPFSNRGAVISFFTKLGANTHEGCDEALIEAVFGGGG
jgi:hypothetical protein